MMKTVYSCLLTLFLVIAVIIFFSVETVEGQSEDTRSPVLSIGKVTFFKWKVSFFKSDLKGPPSPAEDGIFRKDEQIILILENIETFKEANGEHWYNSDVSIETSEGESVFSKEGDLRDMVKDKLPNGILELYNITVNPELIGIKPGKYIFRATIYDKIGGGKASVSKEFTILHDAALKEKPAPPSTAGMEATEKKPVSGTISVKGKSTQINHIYAFIKPNDFFEEKENLHLLFTDNAIGEDAIPKDKNGSYKLLDLMREGKVHAFEILFDIDEKKLTNFGTQVYVYHKEVSPGALGDQGSTIFKLTTFNEKIIEGEAWIDPEVLDFSDMEWDFHVKFRSNIPNN